MTGDSKDNDKSINTGGEVHIRGAVSVGGDFVGRDKVVTAGDRGVVVGGNITSSNVVTGNGNVVGNSQGVTADEFRALLAEIRTLIPQSGLDERKVRTLEGDVETVVEEAEQEKPDGGDIVHRLEGATKALKAVGKLTDAGKKLLPMVEKAAEWAGGLFV